MNLQKYSERVRGFLQNAQTYALGEGNPLFKSGTGPAKMRLLEARPLQTGCVLLFYAPEPAAAAA